MKYEILARMAAWQSSAVEHLISATTVIHEATAKAIDKVEQAAFNVEQRIHDKALSAAEAVANKEHEVIQAAHDRAIQAVIAARAAARRAEAVLTTSYEELDGKVEAVYAKLGQRAEIHAGQ